MAENQGGDKNSQCNEQLSLWGGEAQVALGQRQASESIHHFLERLHMALQKQHIAILKTDTVQPRAQEFSLARDRQQVHAITAAQVERAGRAADHDRVRHNHAFEQGDIIGIEICLLDFLIPDQFKP
jgi:hypothetical protein